MRQLTANEIYRTSFKHIENWRSGFGFTHPDRDHNEMCPYCKNEDTDIVRDAAHLEPFNKFYGEKKFKVVSCHCCSAVFSFWYDKEPL